MKLERIRALLRAANIAQVRRETGLSIRVLYYVRDGKTNITLGTLSKLQEWAKGRRLPRDSGAAATREAAGVAP